MVSIHAPREGSDFGKNTVDLRPTSFNPRSPRRERPSQAPLASTSNYVSIHAPREGSDFCSCALTGQWRCFNPRSPRRERPRSPATSTSGRVSIHAPREGSDHASISSYNLPTFQSTLPAKGATSGLRTEPCSTQFQSTLPAKGATTTVTRRSGQSCFNPRSPRRERQGIRA